MEQTPDPLIGTTFADRYRIERQLGAGGMGCVYIATQLSMDRQVALKVLAEHVANSDSAIKRFHREMQATARVSHQNTIRVFDYGRSDDGQLFLAMELLDGITLHELLRNTGALETGRALHIASQIARALGAAHSEGIVHRDLKPENVMLLDRYGERDFVKVLDFGIACFAHGPDPTDGEPQITKAGTLIGTPLYMSPEQVLGQELDSRSDLYALGVLLFQMATGTVPFSDPTPVRVLFMHAHQPPPLPSQITPGQVPARLEQLILRLLAKAPNDRPQTAADVVRELRESTEAATHVETDETLKPGSQLTDPKAMTSARAAFHDPQIKISTQQQSVTVDTNADSEAPTAEGMTPVVSGLEPVDALVAAPTMEAAAEDLEAPPTAVAKPVTIDTGDDIATGAMTMVAETEIPETETAETEIAETETAETEIAEQVVAVREQTEGAREKSKVPLLIGAAAVLAVVAGIAVFAAGSAEITSERPKPVNEPVVDETAPLRAEFDRIVAELGAPSAPKECQTTNLAELKALITAANLLEDGKPRSKRPSDREAAKSLTELKSSNAEVQAYTAKALLYAGANDTEIISNTTRALITCKNHALAHAVAGTVHMLAQRPAQADKSLAMALIHAPKYRTAQFNYALVAVMKRDGDGALKRIDALLSDAPKHPGAHVLRGQANLLRKDPENAVKDLLTAVEKKPDNPNAHLVLSMAYRANGQTMEANISICEAADLGHPRAEKQCKR